MKAIGIEEFGSSNKLKLMDVPLRDLRLGEVRIGIQYTSVNPVDWKIREGYLKDRAPHQFPVVAGWDAAGEVVAVADDVNDWKVGDRVMAYTRLPKIHAGTYAEYINVPSQYLAKVPKGIDLSHAAALPLVGLTAYQALFDVIKLKADDRLLITAGAGGVGSLAIQFAKIAGAEVTATGSTANHGYLKELGADHVVDYTKASCTDELKAIAPHGFSAVLDAAGGNSLQQAWSLISTNGRLVSIVETPDPKEAGREDVAAAFHFVEPNGSQLSTIAKWLEEDRLKVPKIEIRSVKDAAAAQDDNQRRHVRGKIVLKIDF